jgi:hypothetical protein
VLTELSAAVPTRRPFSAVHDSIPGTGDEAVGVGGVVHDRAHGRAAADRHPRANHRTVHDVDRSARHLGDGDGRAAEEPRFDLESCARSRACARSDGRSEKSASPE